MSYFINRCPWCGESYDFGVVGIQQIGTGHPECVVRDELPKMSDEMVQVPRDLLRMLYECAKSYDSRIPEGNGSTWAIGFRRLFEVE